MSELISVIVPVYKSHPLHLKQCIDSILNQTYSNLELILVYKKDSQQDNDLQKIFDENKTKENVRIIEDDSNAVEARNVGIRNSRGSLIGIIDSDDMCINTRFEEQVKFMHDTKMSLVGSWAIKISHDGNKIGTAEPPYSTSEIRKKIMLHNPILHSSVLMKKDMIEKIGFYKSEFFPGAEDYEMFLRAISNGYKIANIPKHLIYLRETKSSLMRGSQWKLARQKYLKAKKEAIKHYGFTRYYDIFYFLITNIAVFVSPDTGYKIKNKFGWDKETN